MPLRFATWVGYDMDGRTDISWATSLRYRLEEKSERLASYAEALAALAPDQADLLRAASGYAATQAGRLAATLRELLGDRARLLNMAMAARRLAKMNAAEQVARACLEQARS